jgi:hypothetical protein
MIERAAACQGDAALAILKKGMGRYLSRAPDDVMRVLDAAAFDVLGLVAIVRAALRIEWIFTGECAIASIGRLRIRAADGSEVRRVGEQFLIGSCERIFGLDARRSRLQFFVRKALLVHNTYLDTICKETWRDETRFR